MRHNYIVERTVETADDLQSKLQPKIYTGLTDKSDNGKEVKDHSRVSSPSLVQWKCLQLSSLLPTGRCIITSVWYHAHFPFPSDYKTPIVGERSTYKG